MPHRNPRRRAPEAGNAPSGVERFGRQLDNVNIASRSAVQPVALRDYQVAGIAEIRRQFLDGAARVLYVLPTGGGKTTIFVFIVAAAVARGKRVLILVHRSELIDQIAAALEVAGVAHGVIAPGFPETEAPVQIASVASLARQRRLEQWRGKFDLVVIDEAHHAVAGSWAFIIASQPKAHFLGVTATPERLDGRGLGGKFEAMVEGPPPDALSAAGWLARFTVYTPAHGPDLSHARTRSGDYAIEDIRDAVGGVVIQSAVAEYLRRCAGVPAVVFCVDVQHSTDVANAFRAAGVRGYAP